MIDAATPETPVAPARRRGVRPQSLRTLVRARLLVATIALPVGVLLRPEADAGAWTVLATSLGAVAVLSAIFEIAARTERWTEAQLYAQLASDLVLVAALSACTGGRDSQFVLFFALVAITGGLLGRLSGGLFAACGAGILVPLLPQIAAVLSGTPSESSTTSFLPPGMLMAFLLVVGVLAGMLGRRVDRAHDELERTTRELDRVRVDNDVILRHLATGILTVDGWGTVAYLNPAAEQVLGLRTADVRGRAIREALPERLGALRDVVMETLEARSSRSRAEVMAKTPKGSGLPLGLSTNLLTHEGAVTGVVAVFQDLTEVREMERRARRNQTLAEVGALAAAIAHELRNGLNPISGSVECLQRELKLEGENAVLMELIGTECVRLNRFVTDLLNYSRERDLAPERLEVDDHLAELCDGLRLDPRCAASGITVRHERGDVPVSIRADREQMRQVWLNLAHNAFDAMPKGGRLVVGARLAGPNEGGGARVRIGFTDEGTGIPADILPRVGEPFFTTKQGGTGLGLSIAQRIVERHGGTLSFESAPGRGTTASVTLPCAVEVLAGAA